MSEADSPYVTTPIDAADVSSEFSCGVRALDDYFARHALKNDATGIGRAYVLHAPQEEVHVLPRVLGFYTLSMAHAEAAQLGSVLGQPLPRYPMPVALIGRLAVAQQAQGRGLGEKLLMDALLRIIAAARIMGCLGVIVDAKDEAAERFYAGYDFVPVVVDSWPHRMFLPLAVARAVFVDD